MTKNQNETGWELLVARREARVFAPRTITRAFTLTELLVVITIIAVLASLITVAVSNALRKANQARITLEIQQLSNAVEDFKNDFGAYPPNVYPIFDASLSIGNPEKKTAANDIIRFMKKAFSRSSEFQVDMSGAVPARNGTAINDNLYQVIESGLTPGEALVFWLQGFGQDISRPLSSSDLDLLEVDDFTTATVGDTVFAVTIDSRSPRFDFDRGRLRPTRFISMARPGVAAPILVLLYEYLPPNSEKAYIYFDTSRRTPLQTVNDFPHNPNPTTIPGHEFFVNLSSDELVVPLKQLRTGAPDPPTLLNHLEYVEQGKFQILHAGIDDAWGSMAQSQLDGTTVPALLFPTGPFIGDIADTVGNFGTGTLADEQE